MSEFIITAVRPVILVVQFKGLLSPLSEGLDLKAFAQSPIALLRPSVPLVLGWRGLLERALWRGAGGPRDLEICCFFLLYPQSKLSALAHRVAKVLLPRHRDTGG